MPQPPQFCESLEVSTQVVPQAACPEGQLLPLPPDPVVPPPPLAPPEPVLEQAAIRRRKANPSPFIAVFIAMTFPRPGCMISF